ncbi:cytochrome c-type biogenesis protein [Moraxella sp. ZJ142]|uniref:cytochrome c-type biogenesis protein n=1 Tax=Moraxella marmotae TaxID=3344520 RepID=UPI0035D46CC3
MKSAIIALLLGMSVASAAFASIDIYEFDSPNQEVQYRRLIEELRCPKCQNQNLAGSDAPIAQDLKQKTYEMVKAGRTDDEIRDYMFARYGDYISYKPPVRPSTWILWFFPPILLVLLLLGWIYKAKKGRTAVADIGNAPLSSGEEAKLAKILSHYGTSHHDKNHAGTNHGDNANHQTNSPDKTAK